MSSAAFYTFRYLHGQCRELPIDLPRPVMAALVNVLAVRGELGPGGAGHGIEETADFCHELLDLEISILTRVPSSLHFVLCRSYRCPSPGFLRREISFRESHAMPSKSTYAPTRFARNLYRACPISL